MKKKLLVIIFILLLVLTIVLIELEKVTSFDDKIYYFLTTNMNDTMISINKFITFFGSTLWISIVTLFICLISIIRKKYKYGSVVLGCVLSSVILNNFIKIIIQRQRPIDRMLVNENTFSFPSGHTMAAVSLYGILIYLVCTSPLTKKVKIILSIILSLLILSVGLSRIYLGAHFATDILGAIYVSMIWIIIYIEIIKKRRQKITKKVSNKM